MFECSDRRIQPVKTIGSKGSVLGDWQLARLKVTLEKDGLRTELLCTWIQRIFF